MRKYASVLLGVLLLPLDIVSGSLEEDVFLSEDDHRELDVSCSEEDDLFFNMDITIDDFGGECSSKDAHSIGKMLQGVVREMEREVLDNQADLDLTVCPDPIVDTQERSLRASFPSEKKEERNLQRRNKKFVYKCGGHYIRCAGTNGRRSLNDKLGANSVCEIAGKATYAADIAATAFRDAEYAYLSLKEIALECKNMRAGEQEVILTQKALAECRKELDVARTAAKDAGQACELSKSASSAAERIQYMAAARETSVVAMAAAEKVRGWLFVIESGFGPEVCGDVVIPNEMTLQAAHDFANTALFGAEMADIASNLTETAYFTLRQHAIDCTGTQTAKDSITWARGRVYESKQALKLARNEAEKAKRELNGSTTRPLSTSELTELVQNAKRASIKAISEAEQNQGRYLRMQEELESDPCSQDAEHGFSGTASTDTICQLADLALYDAAMTAATAESAKAILSDIMRDALECSELGRAESAVITARQAMMQAKNAQKRAEKKGKLARRQCTRSKKTQSQQQVKKYRRAAAKASRQATYQAKQAENALSRIRSVLDRNVCGMGVSARSSDISAATVCQAASSATFRAATADAAVLAAKEIFSLLQERALDCYDLQHGQRFITAAKEVVDSGQQSQNLALSAANRARKLCRSAKRASSEDELRQLIQSVEKLVRDSTQSSEAAAAAYRQIRDDFDGQFCTEAPENVEQGINSGPPKTTFKRSEDNIGSFLESIAKTLYAKIPQHIQKGYENLRADCIVEGFNVNVRIDALARIEDRAFWITEESCSSL